MIGGPSDSSHVLSNRKCCFVVLLIKYQKETKRLAVNKGVFNIQIVQEQQWSPRRVDER